MSEFQNSYFLRKKKYIRHIDSNANNALANERLQFIYSSGISASGEKYSIYKNFNQPKNHYYGLKRKIGKYETIIDEVVIHATGGISQPTQFFNWMMYKIYRDRNKFIWMTETEYNNKYKNTKVRNRPSIQKKEEREGVIYVGLDSKNRKRYKQYCRGVGLWHYYIPREGNIIYEIIDPDQFVYHSTSGSRDKRTIGIELGSDNRFNEGKYHQKQYEMLHFLINDYLRISYPTINKISNHTYRIVNYSSKNLSNMKQPKHCPGPYFEWKLLEKEWERLNFNPQKVGSNLIKKQYAINMSEKLKGGKYPILTKDVYVPDMYKIDFWPNLELTLESEKIKKWHSLNYLAKKWDVTINQLLMKNAHVTNFIYKKKGRYYCSKDCIIFKPK